MPSNRPEIASREDFPPDLSFDASTLAQHQRLTRYDRPLDFPFDSKCPRKLDRALQANGLIEKPGPLAGFSIPEANSFDLFQATLHLATEEQLTGLFSQALASASRHFLILHI